MNFHYHAHHGTFATYEHPQAPAVADVEVLASNADTMLDGTAIYGVMTSSIGDAPQPGGPPESTPLDTRSLNVSFFSHRRFQGCSFI